MKTLIVYDSYYGNTKLIAETVAKELGEGSKVVHVDDIGNEDFKDLDLLIVGSPVLGWRPSDKTSAFLGGINSLKGVKICSFDSRVKLFIHGDATKKMSEKLVSLGGEMIVEPNMFYVKGKEGPLYEGEIERAKEWAKVIKEKI